MRSFLIGLYVFANGFLFPIHKDKKQNHFTKDDFKIKKIGSLNTEKIPECSGICPTSRNTFLVHNDGGNKPTLFEVDLSGNLLNRFKIENTKNIDWEDITQDNAGNTYIADVGNNYNTRDNLLIYKLNSQLEKIAEIHFNYPDQHTFPPQKENMNFDCEAIFWYENHLYLFSKNRGNKWVKMYKIPSIEGNYTAEIVDSIALKGWITGADISPSKKEFTLLSYGHVYKFEVKKNELNFSTPKSVKYVKRISQAEGICYLNDSTLIITNEQGQIFRSN